MKTLRLILVIITFVVTSNAMSQVYNDPSQNNSNSTQKLGRDTTDVPVITIQPLSQSICESQPVTFQISADNADIYQWQEYITDWNNVLDSGKYSGANSPVLNISGVLGNMDNYEYRCIASNTYGNTISDSAVLTINYAPSISGQPLASTICEGSNTSFEVVASGTNPDYQWQVNDGTGYIDIIDGDVYSGATTSTLAITTATNDMNGLEYQCVVKGTCTPNAISDAVLLTVNSAPSISEQPISSSICEGSNTSFKVTAFGTGLNYQWQYISDLGNSLWNNLYESGNGNEYGYSGTNTNTLVITGASYNMNGIKYRCEVSGICIPFSFITSETANLNVHEQPKVNLGNDTILCDYLNIRLDAGPGFNYFWSNPLLSGQIVTIDTSIVGMGIHMISVTVTNSNNCDGSDSIEINFIPCPVKNNSIQNSSITVQPNPTSGLVYINFNSMIKEAEIEVFNIQGEIVKMIKIYNVMETHIDMSKMVHGIYSIKIISDDQVLQKKLIVN